MRRKSTRKTNDRWTDFTVINPYKLEMSQKEGGADVDDLLVSGSGMCLDINHVQ
jgi:hypothetical protein